MIVNESFFDTVGSSSDAEFLHNVYRKFKRNPQIMCALILNSFLPADLMDKLANHSDATVREALAARHKWSSEQIMHLFGIGLTDEEYYLRVVTPTYILEKLVDDDNINVAKAAFLNQSAPVSVVEKFLHKNTVEFLETFVEKEYYDDLNVAEIVSEGLLKLIQLDSSYELKIAENRHTPAKFVEYLYFNRDEEIRKTLLVHTDVPPSVVEDFLGSLTVEKLNSGNKKWVKSVAGNLPDGDSVEKFFNIVFSPDGTAGSASSDTFESVCEGILINHHSPSHVVESVYTMLYNHLGYFSNVEKILPLLENPNTPPHILHSMCVSEEPWIEDNVMSYANALCSNPNTPFESLMDEKFFKKIRTAYVVWKLSQNEKFTSKHLNTIVYSDIPPKVLSELTGMLTFTEEQLTYIALTAGRRT